MIARIVHQLNYYYMLLGLPLKTSGEMGWLMSSGMDQTLIVELSSPINQL